MCIIVIKEKKQNFNFKVLENCFNGNRDGSGLMFAHEGKVNIYKGFMTFKDFKNKVQSLDKKFNLKSKNVVMHFRITTSGNTDGFTCHPYPVSDKEKDLKKLHIKTDLGVVHNGIISQYSGGYGGIYSSYYVNECECSTLNDTQQFIMNDLSFINEQVPNWYKDKKWRSIMEDLIGSKFALLDGEGNYYLVGSFVKDDSYKGYVFSNSTYKTYKVKSYKYANSVKTYNYYDSFLETIKKEKEDTEWTIESLYGFMDGIRKYGKDPYMMEMGNASYLEAYQKGIIFYYIPEKIDYNDNVYYSFYNDVEGMLVENNNTWFALEKDEFFNKILESMYYNNLLDNSSESDLYKLKTAIEDLYSLRKYYI